jgi:threonine/homoserine/homoserine lactone efflux protein
MVEALVMGVILGLTLVLSVGPVIFTVIKQSLTNGHKGGFSFIVGVWLSDLLLIIVSNGFSQVVASFLIYQKMLAILGSGFLIAMGLVYVFFKKVKLYTSENENTRFRKRDVMKILGSGFLINTLNPSVFLFWLNAATVVSAKFDSSERLVFFSVCMGVNMFSDVLKVLMSGLLSKKLTLHTIGIINKVSGTLLICFGMALLYRVLF